MTGTRSATPIRRCSTHGLTPVAHLILFVSELCTARGWWGGFNFLPHEAARGRLPQGDVWMPMVGRSVTTGERLRDARGDLRSAGCGSVGRPATTVGGVWPQRWAGFDSVGRRRWEIGHNDGPDRSRDARESGVETWFCMCICGCIGPSSAMHKAVVGVSLHGIWSYGACRVKKNRLAH